MTEMIGLEKFCLKGKLGEERQLKAEIKERKGTFSGTFARPHFDFH